MIFDSTSNLPGLPETSLDGLSFFEDEVGEIFNDVGDIWGSDDGLGWDLELDADIFSDPAVAEGLPVNRPEKIQDPEMTMPGLARAVREENERLAAKEVPISDSKKPEEKKENKEVEKIEKGQAVWSFDGFSSSTVEPPSRHAVKREKDVGLLDILGMKSAEPVCVETKELVGSQAPSFPDLPPPPVKKTRTKRPSVPKKKKVVDVPLGSMTGSFLDLMPERKKDEQEAVRVKKSKPASASFFDLDFSSSSVETATQNVPLPVEERPLMKESSDEEKASPEQGVESGFDGGEETKDIENKGVVQSSLEANMPSAKKEPAREPITENEGDGGFKKEISVNRTEGENHDAKSDKQSIVKAPVKETESVSNKEGKPSPRASSVIDSSVRKDKLADLSVENKKVVVEAAPDTLSTSVERSAQEILDAPVSRKKTSPNYDDSVEFEDEKPGRLMTDEEMINLINEQGMSPKRERRVLPPRQQTPAPSETPTNRRPPRVDYNPNPDADEIEIEDDLDFGADDENHMNVFLTKNKDESGW